MKSHHVTWICVIGTSTVAGLLVGRLATKDSPSAVEREVRLEESLDDAWSGAPASFPGPSFGPSDVRVADLERDEPPAKSNPPGVLPEPDDAAPITSAPIASAPETDESTSVENAPSEGADRERANEALVREMIEEQLPHASPQERDIWYEELKGLPTDKLVEVLRIRKYLGSIVPLPELPEIEDPLPPGDNPPLDPERDDLAPAIVDVEPPSFDPANLAPRLVAPPNRRYESRALENSLVAIASAERVHLNNIANANTYGFRRSRPMLVDLPAAKGDGRPSAANGCQLACVQIDVAQGSLVATDRPLDLAIVGRGYLQFTKGDQVVYGRCGALTLNADGQLVSLTGLLVEPAITFPNGARQFVVASDGTVSVLTSGTDAVEIGQLQLATFPNPGGLNPIGDAMFEETRASGTPSVATPGTEGAGSVRSTCLEAANVDLELERRELQRLQRQASVIRELLGTPSRAVDNPNIARPAVSGPHHRTSATDTVGSDERTSATSRSPGPFLVLRPDMLPE